MVSENGFVDREKEFSRLKKLVERTSKGKGRIVFVTGEAGIGKTRIVDEIGKYAESNNFMILKGRCAFGADADPFLPFIDALKTLGLDYLFAEKSPMVEYVFVVDNDSSLLLSEIKREDVEMDSQIFTSMLGAVQDFVSDSFSKFGKGKRRLDVLGYEDYRILINYGDFVHLVVVISGTENNFLKNDMKKIVDKIEKNYGGILKKWGGDMDSVKGAGDFTSSLISKYDTPFFDPKLRRETIFRDVSTKLIEKSKKQPVFLFIDDLHWADPSSLNLLYYLSRDIKESSLLICCAYRPEDVSKNLMNILRIMKKEKLFDEIRLKNLGENDVLEMIKPYGVSGGIDEIYEKSNGNPLYVSEFLRSGENEIPPKIEDIILGRVEKLGGETLKVLEYASIVGESFDFDVLSKTTNMDEEKLGLCLENLLKKHFISEYQDRYKFEHGMIKDVLHSNFSIKMREIIHKKVGFAMEDVYRDKINDVLAELAFHFSKGNVSDKAVKYSLLAGEKAKNLYANHEALRHYENALKFLGKKEDKKVDVLIRIGDLHNILGEWDNALKCYEEATIDEEKKPECYLRIGNIYRKRDEWDKALEYYGKSMDLYQSVNAPSALSELYNNIGHIYSLKGDTKKALSYYKKSLESAEIANDKKWMGEAFRSIGLFYDDRGDYIKAEQCFKKSADLLRDDLGSLSKVYNSLSVVYYNANEYNKSIEYATRKIKISEKIGDLRGVGYGLLNACRVYEKRKQIVEAVGYCNKAFALFKKMKEERMIAASFMHYGIIYGIKKDFVKSFFYFEKAVSMLKKLGILYDLGETYFEYGLMNKHKGDDANAKKLLEKAMDSFQAAGAEKYVEKVREEISKFSQ
ncbi:MAG: tetratricopeptide repeat protein [Thermoplasmatales archaeon]|nr:tetratricopeptide repeat protein [Thermoplasmatales archaeon]